MKCKALFIFAIGIVLSAIGFAQADFGKAVCINDGWKFILHDEKDAYQVSYNDNNWQAVQLPHDWSIKEPLSPAWASCMGYLPGGIGWYRKTLYIPKDKQFQRIYFYFEGVYNRSEVFINGHSVGKRPNGYVSFMYDVTPYIKYGETNILAVKVDHSRSADSRWYTGSGIYRNVWMVYANSVHIAQWGTYAYPQVNNDTGILHVESEIENNLLKNVDVSIVHQLIAPNGRIVTSSTNTLSVLPRNTNKIITALKITNPQLWSIDHPVLYKIKTIVIQDGKRIDASETNTGFRSFTFDPDKGFALNGKWMKIKGVCMHHDAGVLGSAVPKEVWKRRLLTLKEIGCNAIRTTHNPQAPEVYDLCDELGILVSNEAFDEWEYPKRKWIEGWNMGTPGFQGSYDFFKEWGEKDLADMVRRDRNHISVFAWSIGNEVDYPNDPYSHPILNGSAESGFTQPIFGGYKKDAPDASRLGVIAKSLATVVRRYDLSRPVTAGLAGVAISNETDYPGALDIVGYNYTESRYKADHIKYTRRVIYGSENRHELSAWKAVTDNKYIFGQFLWTGIDYLGESGRWPSRGFYSGLLDFGGFIKPRGYFRQSLWSAKPMAYLGTYISPVKNAQQLDDVSPQFNGQNAEPSSMDAWPIWNYQEGQVIRVVCYTNAAKAKLLVNGVQAGETKNYDYKTGIIFWDIPYHEGRLEVIGMDAQGKNICQYHIQTAREVHSLTIKILEKEYKLNEVIHVVLQAVDEKGIPVMLSDNEVTIHLEGPAKLLGMEAGNNTDMSDYTDNNQRLYHGRMILYIKGIDPGEVKITCSSYNINGIQQKITFK